MEYFWYIMAALGAGIGTGLAGLSAATVMVPILIVLCPSFAGETGAYQATAVALASDILGSAVTSFIYIKHKNIDLKHGWIMLVCIITMCVGGSVAAWGAGNMVLGTFSLFLTFGIGIRFLLKPDTERKDAIGKDAKLDKKAIAVSLFFGLTIGFGTGFFGSGGGMMMLVVFTAFLGMPMKHAVGTSTLIMTFTALIASVSHMIIEPAIVFERTDALLICIVTATIASIVSAQFANRFSTKIVGIVTGAVLTVLGACMLILHFKNDISEFIVNHPYMQQILVCLGKYTVSIICIVIVLLIIRFTLKPPGEVFRKLLHLAAFSSSVLFVNYAENWIAASASALVFAAVVFPVLAIFEKNRWYSSLFIERKHGEIKKSLWLLFAMTALLIAVCWGGFGQAWIALTAILSWGVGDACAALVGKSIGKHHVHLKYADHKKTWEGTGAMALAGFLICFICLGIYTEYAWGICLVISAIMAPCGAYTELVSHNGNDTVSVPIVNAAILSIMYLGLHFFGI